MKQTRPLPPRDELVNALEYEDVAKLTLPAAVFSTIAGSDRSAFDRLTFRPRMCIPVLDLNVTVDLFGAAHFTPILVGPVAEQRRYHREGELATVRGASAAKAGMILSNRSSVAVGEVTHGAKTPLWYSVYADAGATARAQAADAVAAGCKVVCITAGARIDWRAIDQIRNGLAVPVVIKGVMTTSDAKAAVERGAQGIIVSNHGQHTSAMPAPIEVLPSIADTVAGKAAVMIDGDFRRGSDILKALILGARGVLVARPVMWALAAYGAEGVQSVIELLQTDLARHLGALGAANLATLQRSHVRIHRR
jgi:4-hydroxymandelate oxidase